MLPPTGVAGTLSTSVPFARKLDLSLLRGRIMHFQKSSLSLRAFLFVCFLIFYPLRAVAQTNNISARITQAVDEKNLVVLKGNVHPLARPEFDQGPVADAQPLRRMLLLLQRSPDQETALRQLLDDQQSKSSSNYHVWLTPDQFGKQFGPADSDIQVVTDWLLSQGFTDIKVGSGRTVIEFSGNVALVRNAFHTEIHRYLVAAVPRMANASDPQIPTVLAPVVAGVVSLQNFPHASHIRVVGSFHRSKATGEVKPLFTPFGSSNFFPLAPADFAKIYNVAPLLGANPPIDGTGQAIAIVGESNINVQDVVDFRKLFGLPQNFSGKNIILNGPDPGINGSEGESDLDIQWSGAVAPGATIDFVTSAPTETTSGVHLSAVYIVDHNLAAVMSESFGECEQSLGSVGNQFYNSLWEQAAAQGITVILSSGDGGSAGCDNFDTQQVASQGLAVSGFASTPFNVAVGGTDFDQASNWSQYWSTTNDPVTQASVKGYIPEIPWNDSCAQLGISGCGASAPQGSLNIVAGSGGPSTIYPKPLWQSGNGVPQDNKRDLPDVSLFASNGFTGSLYIICQADVVTPPNPTCNLNNFGFTFQGTGGTSASAPAFAGLIALVNQKQASAQNQAPRQGNANYVLYALAKAQANATPALNCNSSASPAAGCTFNDITKGNSALPNGSVGVGTNAVPCAGASPNCSSGASGVNGVLVDPAKLSSPAWTTNAGYDMATGLGSINAQNLVNNWNTANQTATTIALTLNNNSTAPITHGASVPVQVKVTPTGATGDASLIADMGSGNTMAFDFLSLAAGGTASSNTASLPGGINYKVHAHYAGDGINAPSDSNPISVTVGPESSKTLITIPVFDPSTGRETGNTPASVIYGSPYIARVDVGNANVVLSFPQNPVCSPPSCPTGTITLADSFNGAASVPIDGGTFSLNTSGFAEDFAIQLTGGSHVISASYSGDNSFNASSSTYALTITPGATRIISSNPPLPPVVATPFNLAVILTMNFFGVMPSCNFTFYDGTTALQGTPTCAWQANGPFLYVSLPVSQTTVGTHTYTAKFNGDANHAPSTSAPITTNAFYGTTTTLSADSTNVQYGTSITLTAVVDSTLSQGPSIGQSVTFSFNNNPVTGTVTYTPFTDPSGNIALRASLTTVPQSSGFYTANFAGDTNYFQSGALLNVSVNIPDFSLAANLPTSSITAGNSATATISVTPASNSSSPVSLACPPNGMPMGISCSFSPGTVNLSKGTAATSTLTISTLPPSASITTTSAPLESPPSYFPLWPFWPMPVVSILSLPILFLLLPRLRRSRLALGATIACAISLFLGFAGCGGGSTGGVGGGPAPSSITLTTSSVKVPWSASSGGSVNLTANVSSSKTPGGTVTFSIDASNGFSANSPVVGGVAQLPLTNLSVGIHSITAQYSGDANTLSSQTKGSLNVVVTGQIGVGIQANTGGLFHSIGVNFNLQ
jgi:hypothetical protein